MSSILDIDLDYFNLVERPVQCLKHLLQWAEAPVAFIVERHHEVLRNWKARIERGTLRCPSHILHVDEHHDLMNGRENPNSANFMYHAMRTWPDCRVHWLVEQSIDSPSMWLDDEVWGRLSKRFSVGSFHPRGWPKPDLVSVCSSPGFLDEHLCQQLLEVAGASSSDRRGGIAKSAARH